MRNCWGERCAQWLFFFLFDWTLWAKTMRLGSRMSCASEEPASFLVTAPGRFIDATQRIMHASLAALCPTRFYLRQCHKPNPQWRLYQNHPSWQPTRLRPYQLYLMVPRAWWTSYSHSKRATIRVALRSLTCAALEHAETLARDALRLEGECFTVSWLSFSFLVDAYLFW